jgi:hypothetical protein
MKIIQIVITTGFGGSAKVFGLGDDSLTYRWNYGTGSWMLYMKSTEAELDKEKEND